MVGKRRLTAHLVTVTKGDKIMSKEHGEGFFGSVEDKERKIEIIKDALAKAYVAGRYSAANSPKPAEYAENKMPELKKKLEGRPW